MFDFRTIRFTEYITIYNIIKNYMAPALLIKIEEDGAGGEPALEFEPAGEERGQ
jgi:hypothetical protein